MRSIINKCLIHLNPQLRIKNCEREYLVEQPWVEVMTKAEQIVDAGEPRARSKSRPPESFAFNLTNCVVDAVWIEFRNVLIPTALTTSALNMVECYKITTGMDNIFRYLPGHPVLIGAIIRRVIETDFDNGTRESLECLFDKINFGKRLIRECKLFSNDSGNGAWAELHIVVEYWRRICSTGIICVDALGRYSETSSSPPELAGEMIDLLERARGGESPYLGNDGDLLFPAWAERRQSSRRLLDVTATVWCGPEQCKAFIRDISRRGLLLDRIFGLRRNAKVVVEFDSGRRVDGMVAWTAAGRAGIELEDELGVNDPLLTKASER